MTVDRECSESGCRSQTVGLDAVAAMFHQQQQQQHQVSLIIQVDKRNYDNKCGNRLKKVSLLACVKIGLYF